MHTKYLLIFFQYTVCLRLRNTNFNSFFFSTLEISICLELYLQVLKIAHRYSILIHCIYFVFAEPCAHNEYRCVGTGHCIQKSLQCNGVNNCPDDSDEAMPQCLSAGAIAGIAIGVVLFIVAVVVIIIAVCVAYERRKRARIIKVRQLLQTFRLENKLSNGHLSNVSSTNSTKSTNSMRWLEQKDSNSFFQ